VARDFVAKFRAIASAPMYYVELPFTQHAFDISASRERRDHARRRRLRRIGVTRPRLTASLVKSYQVPPTELVVRVSTGEWVGAREAARELGRSRC